MTKTAVELDLETDIHVLRASNVAVHGHARPLLEPTTLSVRTGEVVVVVGEPGHGHTALALLLGGRLRADSGTIALDDRDNDARALQRMVALVDVPGVSEPDDSVPLATIVSEEMSMAGMRATRGSVRRWSSGWTR